MRLVRFIPICVLLSSQFIYGTELPANKLTSDWWSLMEFIIVSSGPFLIVQLPFIAVLLSILIWTIYMRIFKVDIPSIKSIDNIKVWTKRCSFWCYLFGLIGTFVGFLVLLKFLADNGENGNPVPWLFGAMALSTTIIGLIAIGLSYEPIIWIREVRKSLVEDNPND